MQANMLKTGHFIEMVARHTQSDYQAQSIPAIGVKQTDSTRIFAFTKWSSFPESYWVPVTEFWASDWALFPEGEGTISTKKFLPGTICQLFWSQVAEPRKKGFTVGASFLLLWSLASLLICMRVGYHHISLLKMIHLTMQYSLFWFLFLSLFNLPILLK